MTLEIDPDFALIEKTLGAPVPEETKHAIQELWKLLAPQINQMMDFAHGAGKSQVKTAVNEWLLEEIETYKKKRTKFVKKWQLRGLRKILFRIEALKHIVRRMEMI